LEEEECRERGVGRNKGEGSKIRRSDGKRE